MTMSDTNDVFILTLKIKDEFETYLLSHNVSVLLRHHCQVQTKYKIQILQNHAQLEAWELSTAVFLMGILGTKYPYL